MREQHAEMIYRADYTPPPFWIETVELTFDLDPVKTRVLNKMRVRRNPEVAASALRLDGQELDLSRVLVNGQGTSFKLENNQLVLEGLPEGEQAFDLEIFTTCFPAKNTALMGLYVSNGSFFTQCEANGFRRITYFLDRPDVMARYSVTLRAHKERFPVLLSNGNLVEEGDLPEGRHYAKWEDPHKKPCYLFALVAGQLVAREQTIRARNGREHLLQVYVRPGDLDKTEHAMRSLMASIVWDEVRFGLPLDLDRFMIVATSDFNMGAMENKGLNIFNTKFVLANTATATDVDFANIESVVGHEYFHNWTGNRITCRDWFQLSLKEGLTVFRDQEFSQDLAGTASARAVKRIEDVRVLRTAQFPEDAGPMAHPVRPDSYMEINNFYTLTVYEKGAEVVRMMQTLVGREGFAAGMKLYFERFDGQAVTCDDFAQAIADANPNSELAHHLEQFKLWYSQAGTPQVHAQGSFDAAQRRYTLTLKQHCAPTPGQSEKKPFVIPVTLGLISPKGRDQALQLQGWAAPVQGSHTFVLTQPETVLHFEGLDEEPVPSILRGFSAPVILHGCDNEAQMLTRLAHDTDPFNRWEAAQKLAIGLALSKIILPEPNEGLASDGDDVHDVGEVLSPAYLQALRHILQDPELDAAFKELVLTLPSETYLAEQVPSGQGVDPQRIHAVRESMRRQLAQALEVQWEQVWHQHQNTGAYQPDAHSSGRRALAGLALSNLCLSASVRGDAVWPGKAYQRFKDATNMTDRINALTALVYCAHPLTESALKQFYERFKNEPLVLDKWFAIQAMAPDQEGQILPVVQQLMLHPDFTLRNPNRVRSLIFAYCVNNPGAFHRQDAAGYVFWADRVLELDAINPQVAARLARAMDRWSRLAPPYRQAAQEALNRVSTRTELSKDVREVVMRALKN